MQDQYQRTIDYARISLTDACNLACTYCRPKKLSSCSMAKESQVLALAKVLSRLGISKIKLTGGEPLLFPNVPGLIEKLYQIPGIKEVTLTTNGLLFEKQAQALYDAGLRAVTFSLDARDPKVFASITGSDSLKTVLSGIRKAVDLGMKVKINCVPFKENENVWLDVAELAKKLPVSVRLIEMMPIGPAAKLMPLPYIKIKEALENRFGKPAEKPDLKGNGPAEYFQIEGWKGSIGSIAALGKPFCQDCSRIRFSCRMDLQLCLNGGLISKDTYWPEDQSEPDIEKLKALIYRKPKRHDFELHAQTRLMSQMGG
jgi:cyclic pyranopterin phosphate synthase